MSNQLFMTTDINKMKASYTREDSNGCWIWLMSVNIVNGYPQIRRLGQNWKGHRYFYYIKTGLKPPELHHECNGKPNILCVNPDHMSPVERQKNPDSPTFINSKKTHCKRGHEFTKENTYPMPGGRACRICRTRAVYQSRGYPKRHRNKEEKEKV